MVDATGKLLVESADRLSADNLAAIYVDAEITDIRIDDAKCALDHIPALVYFGKDQKGDGDNLWKCIADGLKEARVIHSDAAVSDWIMRVRRDWGAPRTEITVTILEGK